MRFDRLVLVVVTVTLFAVSAQAGAGDDWPQWGGPQGNNISPDKGLLPKWPEAGPGKLVECSGLGAGFSSPTIVGGVIYTTGVDLATKTLQLSAFSEKGKLKWKRKLGEGWIQGGYTGSRCSPTVHEGLVYVLSGKGRLTCCKAATGKPVWAISFKDKFKSKTPIWGFSESPVVAGNLLLCTPGGEKAAMAGLDLKTGKLKWAVKGLGDATAYATPIVFTLNKLMIAAVLTAKGAIGVDIKRGKRLWLHKWETAYDVHANPFRYHAGSLYFSSGYGVGGFRLDLKVKGNKCQVKEAWREKQLDSQHHGLVLVAGRIYGTSHKNNRGQMVCLDFKSGKMLFKGKGVGWSSITYADGKLYCLDARKGNVGLVEPGKKSFDLISSFKMPSGGKGPYWAHPVVVGGRLYLRHDDKLFVYSVRK